MENVYIFIYEKICQHTPKEIGKLGMLLSNDLYASWLRLPPKVRGRETYVEGVPFMRDGSLPSETILFVPRRKVTPVEIMN